MTSLFLLKEIEFITDMKLYTRCCFLFTPGRNDVLLYRRTVFFNVQVPTANAPYPFLVKELEYNRLNIGMDWVPDACIYYWVENSTM